MWWVLLYEMFPRITGAKIKKAIFVGLQITGHQWQEVSWLISGARENGIEGI